MYTTNNLHVFVSVLLLMILCTDLAFAEKNQNVIENQWKQGTSGMNRVTLTALRDAERDLRLFVCTFLYEENHEYLRGYEEDPKNPIGKMNTKTVKVVCETINCGEKQVEVIFCPISKLIFGNFRHEAVDFWVTDSVIPNCYYELYPQTTDLNGTYAIRGEACIIYN